MVGLTQSSPFRCVFEAQCMYILVHPAFSLDVGCCVELAVMVEVSRILLYRAE